MILTSKLKNMPYVEIYELKDDGSQEILTTCRLDDGLVTCEGNSNFIRFLKETGIRDYSAPNAPNLFPKDGLKFLEQLANNFHSGYLMASEIKN